MPILGFRPLNIRTTRCVCRKPPVDPPSRVMVYWRDNYGHDPELTVVSAALPLGAFWWGGVRCGNASGPAVTWAALVGNEPNKRGPADGGT